ncbi:RagB/SusD family nutrient uptake outer membrane protein [Flavobacterium granuli]|uniref:RagB/SusD domain-containing protein n=1 Tax=Flavobacterium granuli TaxID=280093 RepID=A0A1M5RT99_9FLAO|nr:RagB/SusD family nutrient uptake outer membrane protein [Flavobacterium granuli]PRZ22769.1 RagB/SusD domain-containing protein [Flavobacterium granuli]SHH29063.1 RagB/SusD domain-containing protein [Flavobacterium granuli]
MKTIQFTLYVIATLAMLICSSCEDFIAVDIPQSQLTSPIVFESTATADAAMADVYAQIREQGMVNGTFYGLSNLMGNYSDEMEYYGSSIEIKQFTNHSIVPSNSSILALWNATYSQIYASNLILEGLENSTKIADEDKNHLKGEALFLRAFLHFYLVNLFGEVPYVSSTDYILNKTIPKSSQQQLWEHITTELQQAEVLLSEHYPTTERIRANKSVANAMLARVYLYKEDWTNAALKASALIENPKYVWVTNPALEFLKESTATIWALHPGYPGVNTKDARFFVFSSGPPSKPELSPAFVASFESGDLRKNLWVRTISNSVGTWYCPYKYKKTLGTTTSQEYTILFRLAEQYLIRAEARAHLGDIAGAQSDLNKIRNRAGLANTTADTPESLLEAVAMERRSELFTEQGHRWFDLKRTNTAEAVLRPIKSGWENTQVLLPIPQAELLLNKQLLPQNPGY